MSDFWPSGPLLWHSRSRLQPALSRSPILSLDFLGALSAPSSAHHQLNISISISIGAKPAITSYSNRRNMEFYRLQNLTKRINVSASPPSLGCGVIHPRAIFLDFMRGTEPGAFQDHALARPDPDSSQHEACFLRRYSG